MGGQGIPLKETRWMPFSRLPAAAVHLRDRGERHGLAPGLRGFLEELRRELRGLLNSPATSGMRRRKT